MNNEIKEILIKDFNEILVKEFCTDWKEKRLYIELLVNSTPFSNLLDYITNLQQKVKHYEETQTFGDYVKEVNLLVDYKSRIEKAVEYLKRNACYTDSNIFAGDLWCNECMELLNILEGKSDE